MFRLSDDELKLTLFELARLAAERAAQLQRHYQLPECDALTSFMNYLEDHDASHLTNDALAEAQEVAKASPNVDAAFLADAIMAILEAKKGNLMKVQDAFVRISAKTERCHPA